MYPTSLLKIEFKSCEGNFVFKHEQIACDCIFCKFKLCVKNSCHVTTKHNGREVMIFLLFVFMLVCKKISEFVSMYFHIFINHASYEACYKKLSHLEICKHAILNKQRFANQFTLHI